LLAQLLMTIGVVLPLAVDTALVSASLATVQPAAGSRLGLTVVFTAFEVLMPLLGLVLGAVVASALAGVAVWLAVGALLITAALILFAPEAQLRGGAARRLSVPVLLVFGLSVSVDELAIGFSAGLLRLPLALTIALIGLQSVIASQAGFRLGSRLAERGREWAERGAAAALLLVAALTAAETVFGR
jgi:putative Mn2+ efflux pump MntP